MKSLKFIFLPITPGYNMLSRMILLYLLIVSCKRFSTFFILNSIFIKDSLAFDLNFSSSENLC